MLRAKIRSYTWVSGTLLVLFFTTIIGYIFYENKSLHNENHAMILNLSYNQTYLGNAFLFEGFPVAPMLLVYLFLTFLGIFSIVYTFYQHTIVGIRKSILFTFFVFLVGFCFYLLFPYFVIDTESKLIDSWEYSYENDLWIDSTRGFKNFKTDGHHLSVHCPSNHSYSSVWKAFRTIDPNDVPLWPLCKDYYSYSQSTLFRMCCAEDEILQEFDSNKTLYLRHIILLSLFVSYTLFLLGSCTYLRQFQYIELTNDT